MRLKSKTSPAEFTAWQRPSVLGPLIGLLIGILLLKLDEILAFDPMNIPAPRAAAGEAAEDGPPPPVFTVETPTLNSVKLIDQNNLTEERF